MPRGGNTSAFWLCSLQSQRVSCAEIKDPFIYKPILIAVGMRFLQQLSGVTCVLVYLQSIFKKTSVILVSLGFCSVFRGACPMLQVLCSSKTPTSEAFLKTPGWQQLPSTCPAKGCMRRGSRTGPTVSLLP